MSPRIRTALVASVVSAAIWALMALVFTMSSTMKFVVAPITVVLVFVISVSIGGLVTKAKSQAS